MKISPVTFCNTSVEQIIDHHTKSSIIESIRQCSNINVVERNSRLLRSEKDLSYLRNPHVITLVTQGHRWLLYLTQVDHMNICVLIERSIKPGYPYPKMLVVHFSFNEVLYQNTLFDVEIIDNAKGNDSPLLLVCDLIMLKNRSVQNWDPIRRLNTLHTLFENQSPLHHYSHNLLQIFSIFQHLASFPSLFVQILNHFSLKLHHVQILLECQTL